MKKSTFPPRNQFAQISRLAAEEVFKYYEEKDMDFGSQGVFEKKYTEAFTRLIDPTTHGYADAVCSGTAAIFVAINSLKLKKGSEILVSPITDPGMISPLILSGFVPRVIDHAPESIWPTLDEIRTRMTSRVSAIVLNHMAGIPIKEIQAICEWAKSESIKVIEDCSQAHMATINNRALGTFGDVACFSTMFSKSHSTGGRGGVVYTKDLEIYKMVRMLSDKGKPFHLPDFNEKDPGTFTMPALNLNIDEISCAIGLRTLNKLPVVIAQRINFLRELEDLMKKNDLKIQLHQVDDGVSPFFWIFHFQQNKFIVSKSIFAEKLKEAGAPLNTHYSYVVTEWQWVRPYLSDNFVPVNAIAFRDSTFNLLFNENFGKKEAQLIVDMIDTQEKLYCCNN